MSVNIFKNGILSKIAGAVGDAVPLINNFLTNQAGKGAADANTVYVLNNKINEVNNSLAYSENDIVCGKWIDGKPIYRKIINCGSLPNSTAKYVDHNISDLNLITKLYGIALYGDGFCPLPYINPKDTNGGILLYGTSTQITITTNANRSNTSITYVVIEYTKNND